MNNTHPTPAGFTNKILKAIKDFWGPRPQDWFKYVFCLICYVFYLGRSSSKLNKNTAKSGFERPRLLLNPDYEILAAILANRKRHELLVTDICPRQAGL